VFEREWSTIQLSSFVNIWLISFTAIGGSCLATTSREAPGQSQCARFRALTPWLGYREDTLRINEVLAGVRWPAQKWQMIAHVVQDPARRVPGQNLGWCT
jgi:hypothetical protein